MNTVKAITPTDAGLSLVICSGPRGSVHDEWPSIEYTCQLMFRHNPVWTGEYRLGVGHVKPLSYDALKPLVHAFRSKVRMTADEENTSHHWAKGTRFNLKDARTCQLQADTAAKLAQIQGVAPKLNDVCHSLLMDGSAFFDGQRFEEWAADLGYSDDSIKAKATFEACDKIGRALSRSISRDDLEGLREWASNY
jgi:hypothetical protein